jgi:hypothetical protein
MASRVPLPLLALLLALPVTAAGATPPATPPAGRPKACALSRSDRAWLQGALADWGRVSRDFLRQPTDALPWVVLLGRDCAWHLAADTRPGAPPLPAGTAPAPGPAPVFAGRPVPLLAGPHAGSVPVPGGGEVPARPLAFAGTYREDTAAFFVMALPSLWREDPRHAAEADLPGLLRQVLVHEMTHTRQALGVGRRFEALGKQYGLALDFDDDVIQQRYGKDADFRAAWEAERDLLFRAAAAPDTATRRALARQALEAARTRRARHFTGEHAVYGELEDLFLGLEGAGQWAAWKLARARAPRAVGDAQVLAAVRRGGPFWSQDEGLALFLVLDALLPGWQARVFSDTPPSVFALLTEATAGEG